ncbi:Crp/Fnr family transcriptional regulator [Bradyrhizobium sp. CER78]|uniref:Crp/Fnr family transcriptional regulator n=1 Tax=Bradyrhizobium sp. CER78 TaxID=3039162 RepID=UPI00244BC6D2|nr:Crp/Fnr family transcriptional regulator [Bradyrhizobium sp. CER78]MDH2384746.1 Crp/Fnr family transcriptional regulator [Bradyrhizobium sp. CER78]
MEYSTRTGNRLLAALPHADFDLLVPHLRKVSLERDLVLVRSGDPVEQIYFPCTALIAFVMDMPNGQAVATTMVGNEGAAGILSTLRPVRSPMTAVVRVAGTAWQISPARFRAALVRSHALADTVQLHMRSLLVQFQHMAACNALHSVEARLARWLLQIHDQIGQDILPLTQQTLSELLGVRRTTVTHVVQKLRASGAIRSNRRSSIEVDRQGLEVAACECYEIMRDRIDRIVSAEGLKPSGRGAAAHGPQRSHAQPWANGDKVQAHPRVAGASRSRSH